MSAQDADQNTSENTGDEQQTSSDTPELSEEGKERVEKMKEAYIDDRPTAVLPGTDRTITGTAVNEWLDDEGNPKFGKDKSQDDAEKGKPQDDAEKDKSQDNRENA